MQEIIQKINDVIGHQEWFDFSLKYYSASKLIIVGGTSLEYYHEIEIIFSDLFFISCGTEWKTETSEEVLYILEGQEAYDFNVKNNIQQGYTIFEFQTDDFDANFQVAAKSIEYKLGKVYYYKKEDLEDGERLADWIE